METAIGILAIVAIFIILPKTILDFVRKTSSRKKEAELEKMRYQKEILELEIQKQVNEIKLLEEESKKLDIIIDKS